MKKIFVVILFSFFSTLAHSQSDHYYISGTVINKETNLPLQGASVFAQNTTLGTVTNAEGKFSLQLPGGGYDIIVTFTGFTTESKRITSSDVENRNILFEIKPREKEMETVAIVSTSEVKNGWQKYGSFFLDHFIGKTANSTLCTIKNPGVLKFYFSKKKNRLKVMATEPLLIENPALGYNIKYTLDSFTHAYETQVSLYTGYPLFEEMSAANNEQRYAWDLARQEAYKGSILHFMRSVYKKELKEEGFEIQFLAAYKYRGEDKDTALKLKNIYAALNYQKDDSTLTTEIRPNQNKIGIIYTKEKPAAGYLEDNKSEATDFQFSILNFAAGMSIVIEQNGYYFEQNDVSISEYWTWEKMADQLPYNYVATMN